MPIYEEKLISPLAVRFTQDHIRTTFRHGGDVEALVEEVKATPGVGGYDLVLRAPFPAIEVVRWSASRRHREQTEAEIAFGAMDEHWFALDNRRLYCLQRAAVSHWPLRVAVAVEILYTDAGHMKRKYDSTRAGQSVTMMQHNSDTPDSRWDWRQAIRDRTGGNAETVRSEEERAALQAVISDDEASVNRLLDAPGEMSLSALMLSALPRNLNTQVDRAAHHNKATKEVPRSGSKDSGSGRSSAGNGTRTPSTASSIGRGRFDSSSTLELSDGAQTTRDVEPLQFEAVSPLVGIEALMWGTWHGRHGDAYKLQPGTQEQLICMRLDGGHARRCTLTIDQQAGQVFWGHERKYALDIEELAKKPTRLSWRSTHGKRYFTWEKAMEQRAGGRHRGRHAGAVELRPKGGAVRGHANEAPPGVGGAQREGPQTNKGQRAGEMGHRRRWVVTAAEQ